MSLAQLGYIQGNKRYGKPCAFFPKGKELKILVDAILEGDPTADLKHVKKVLNYGSNKYVSLSGANVRELIEGIACPSNDLKYITQSIRYGTDSEFILTGKHIKLLIESIQDLTCLAPPAPIYNVWSATVISSGGFTDTVDNGHGVTMVFVAGDYASFSQSLQTDISPRGAGAVLISGSGSGTNLGFWILSESEPTRWTVNGNPLTFNDEGLAVIKPCFTTGAFAVGNPAGSTDTVDWVMTQAYVLSFAAEIVLGYSDPGFDAAWISFVRSAFGTAAVASSVITPTTVLLEVQNSYVNFGGVFSIDGINQQTDVTAPC